MDDRFVPAAKLGTGAYGSVFTVFRESDGESFAAKSFTCSEDDSTLEPGTIRELSILVALRREREAAGLAPHPNIMRAEAVAELEGIDGLCMIMPKMSMSLGTAIEAKALNGKAKLSVSLGLLRALEFLHANNIIHRDVKPDNILLTDDLKAVLADFSLAKVLLTSQALPSKEQRRGHKRAAAEGGVRNTAGMGTATYMAPEVVNSATGSYTCAADIWSAGVVVYETINGEILSATKDKEAFRVLDDVRARLSADKPVPALMRRLITVDAAERISAADAVVELVAAQRAMFKLAADDERVRPSEPLALDFFRTLASGSLPTGQGRAPDARPKKAAAPVEAASKRRKVGGNAKAASDPESQAIACCAHLDAQHPLTPLLAASIARRTRAKPMHCAVLCVKLLEVEYPNVTNFAPDDSEDEDAADDAFTIDADAYIQDELDILKSVGFSMYTTH